MIRLDNAANDLHIQHNCQRNTVCNLHKYILHLEEIDFATLKNTVIRLDKAANDLHIPIVQLLEKYSLQFTQIHFSNLGKYTLKNTVIRLDNAANEMHFHQYSLLLEKYNLQFTQIHIAISRNTLCNFEKYSDPS